MANLSQPRFQRLWVLWFLRPYTADATATGVEDDRENMNLGPAGRVDLMVRKRVKSGYYLRRRWQRVLENSAPQPNVL